MIPEIDEEKNVGLNEITENQEISEIQEDNTINENDFFADFNTEKQEFEQPEFEEEEDEEKEAEDKKAKQKKTKTINDLGAKTIVNTTDTLLALLLSIYALSDDSDAYKMDESYKKDIITLISEMFPSTSTAFPAWMQLVLIMSAAYMPIVQKANGDRENNLKEKQLKNAKHKVELKKVEDSENEQENETNNNTGV